MTYLFLISILLLYFKFKKTDLKYNETREKLNPICIISGEQPVSQRKQYRICLQQTVGSNFFEACRFNYIIRICKYYPPSSYTCFRFTHESFSCIPSLGKMRTNKSPYVCTIKQLAQEQKNTQVTCVIIFKSVFRISQIIYFCSTMCRRIINCVKSVKIRNFSGPYFPAFGQNTETHAVSLRIQSKSEKIRTRKNSVFGHILRSDICRELLKKF